MPTYWLLVWAQLAVILGLTLFVITWDFAALKGLFGRFVGGDHKAFIVGPSRSTRRAAGCLYA